MALSGASRRKQIPCSQSYARQRLEKLGVEVRNNTRVTNVRQGALDFKDGSVLEAAAIIWAAGISASPLTATLGVPTDRGGRITPNPDLSVPDYPDIFLAGDLVSMKDCDGQMVPGVAPAAVQMGAHVAKALQGDLENAEARPVFNYFDKGMMAIIGKNYAVVQAGKLRLEGFIAWLAWLFIHITFLVGFKNKLSVLLGWAYSYIINNPEARFIVNPPSAYPPGKPPSN